MAKPKSNIPLTPNRLSSRGEESVKVWWDGVMSNEAFPLILRKAMDSCEYSYDPDNPNVTNYREGWRAALERLTNLDFESIE
jgi:hypothetical protein